MFEGVTIPSVGFISVPGWSDAAPQEFQSAVEEPVITQQTFPLLPDFDYTIENMGSDFIIDRFALCARSLRAAGANLTVQVGTPFAWAQAPSEAHAHQRNRVIQGQSDRPNIMTTLAILDALRAHHARHIALCTYYPSRWKACFVRFLENSGFNVIYARSLSEQELLTKAEEETRFWNAWQDSTDLILESVRMAGEARPKADAIIITGTGVRTLSILNALEDVAQCPVIPADTAIYWKSACLLNLTLSSQMASFRGLQN